MKDLRPFLEIAALALSSMCLGLAIYAACIGDITQTMNLLVGSYFGMFAAYVFHE